jgi:hypothetical protein
LGEAVPPRKGRYMVGPHLHRLHPETQIAHIYKAMSALPDGQYWIQNAAPPKSWIGIIGSELEKGVVTEGRINIWTVKKLGNGNYTLTVEEEGGSPFPIQGANGKLVVHVNEPPSEWIIHGSDDGLYTIESLIVAPPPKAWTVDEPDSVPKTPVTLDLNFRQPKQQWNFISWPGLVPK